MIALPPFHTALTPSYRALRDKKGAGIAIAVRSINRHKRRAKTMKVLLLPTSGFSQGSMYPFKHYTDELKTRYKIETTEIVSDDLKEKIQSIKDFDGDLILFSVPWDFGTEGVLDFAIEANREKKQAKLVLFDYLDGNESRFWAVMPHIDLYLKQYLHRDMKKYQQQFTGASEFIQYQVDSGRIENTIQEEVWTNLFQSKLDKKQYRKVMLGWNFGLWGRLIQLAEGNASRVLWAKDRPDKRLVTLAKRALDSVRAAVGGESEPIDIYCRATLYKGWTKAHRMEVIESLNQMPDRYNVISSIKKVGFSEYYREMEQSKIFVSPSGWCEYTPKDYEAMYFGALLIKPCVEHIDTHPNILIPNETYVAVKWDLSDLNEKCEYYLENPIERKRITDNAKKAFVGYFEQKLFVEKIDEVLQKLDIHPEKTNEYAKPLRIAD